MSSSISIPQRQRDSGLTDWTSSSSTSSSYISSSSLSTSRTSPAKGKAPVTASSPTTSSPSSEPISPRRPSLLGSSIAKSEYTVVDLAHSEGPPRLVTCVKSSQGFDWNQELFIPSYADQDRRDLEQRPHPVQDIFLTDEEADAMLPQ